MSSHSSAPTAELNIPQSAALTEARSLLSHISSPTETRDIAALQAERDALHSSLEGIVTEYENLQTHHAKTLQASHVLRSKSARLESILGSLPEVQRAIERSTKALQYQVGWGVMQDMSGDPSIMSVWDADKTAGDRTMDDVSLNPALKNYLSEFAARATMNSLERFVYFQDRSNNGTPYLTMRAHYDPPENTGSVEDRGARIRLVGLVWEGTKEESDLTLETGVPSIPLTSKALARDITAAESIHVKEKAKSLADELMSAVHRRFIAETRNEGKASSASSVAWERIGGDNAQQAQLKDELTQQLASRLSGHVQLRAEEGFGGQGTMESVSLRPIEPVPLGFSQGDAATEGGKAAPLLLRLHSRNGWFVGAEKIEDLDVDTIADWSKYRNSAS
ncbi:hypothetical protein IAT38_004654 [Cryptococcus sp. DSM 104549]